ncbi:MAG: hypothetical protein H0U64_07045 [Gemmatimonadaceae bacterium]|nr:hypothetical protein [Gemmatimonadaceae bacterium]
MTERKKHPMQKIEWDGKGVIRFRGNPIVRWLLDNGGKDLNDIGRQGFDVEDEEHFAQLIGYSVSGFGDLGYCRPETVAAADDIAYKLGEVTVAESPEGTCLDDDVTDSDAWREGYAEGLEDAYADVTRYIEEKGEKP